MDREPIEIVSWNEQDSFDADGLEIVGRLRNSGQEIAAEIEVTVTVQGYEGEPPVKTRAFVGSGALAPGRSTSFRALLPGVLALLGDPVFEVRSEAFGIQAEAGTSDEEAEPGEGDDFPEDDDFGAGDVEEEGGREGGGI